MSSTLLLQLCVFFQGSIAWIRPYLSQQSSSGTHWRPTRSWRWWRDLASRLPGRGSGRGGNTHLPVDKYINVRTWPWGETQNHNFELHLRSISTTWSRSCPWRTLKHVSRFTWRHVKKNLSEPKPQRNRSVILTGFYARCFRWILLTPIRPPCRPVNPSCPLYTLCFTRSHDVCMH